MLGWFIDGFVDDNLLTPTYILLFFIVSVLALAWASFTLFSYHRSSTNATFVALVDLCFFGALIASIYFLRHITDADCANVETDGEWTVHFGSLGSASGPGFDISVSKPCAMLKACFAFGIMNVIMFFFTAGLAWLHGDKDDVRRDRRRSHSRRHSHRSGSRHSHRSRSSHHRRVYV